MNIMKHSIRCISLLGALHTGRALLQYFLHLVLPFVTYVRGRHVNPDEPILILLILGPRAEKVLGYPNIAIEVCREETSQLLDLFELISIAQLAAEPAQQ